MAQKVFATVSQEKIAVWEESPDIWTGALRKVLVGTIIQSHYVCCCLFVPKENNKTSHKNADVFLATVTQSLR